MKDKKIWIFFIASAVALVLSLSLTFGLLYTKADPVQAEGLTIYNFSFATNKKYAGITKVSANTKAVEDAIVFNPDGQIDFQGNGDIEALGSAFENLSLRINEEENEGKLMIIPIRITNGYDAKMTYTVTLETLAQSNAGLEAITYVAVKNIDVYPKAGSSKAAGTDMWDYSLLSEFTYVIEIDANKDEELLMVVYATEAVENVFANNANVSLNLKLAVSAS